MAMGVPSRFPVPGWRPSRRRRRTYSRDSLVFLVIPRPLQRPLRSADPPTPLWPPQRLHQTIPLVIHITCPNPIDRSRSQEGLRSAAGLGARGGLALGIALGGVGCQPFQGSRRHAASANWRIGTGFRQLGKAAPASSRKFGKAD